MLTPCQSIEEPNASLCEARVTCNWYDCVRNFLDATYESSLCRIYAECHPQGLQLDVPCSRWCMHGLS